MRIIIIGLPRSGTTLVAKYLNSHKTVNLFSDELRVKPLFSEGVKIYGMENILKKDRIEGFVDIYDALSKKGDCKYWGAKVAVGDPKDAKILVNTLNSYFNKCKIILLSRHDSVARIGSLIKVCSNFVFGDENSQFFDETRQENWSLAIAK